MAKSTTFTKSEIMDMKGRVETLRKESRWNDMAELQRKMLSANEQSLGEEHPDTLALMHDLAITYSNGKQLENSAKIFRPLYEARRKLLGQEHPSTLVTMHYLAATCTDLGRLGEAESLHRQLLPIRKRILGNEHVDTLRTMQYLAVTCGNMGKLIDARDLYEEMLPIRRRKLGNDHAATVLVMNNLAVTYTDLRQFDKAEVLHREVLSIRRRLKGDETPETIRTMHYLAVTCGEMGRLTDAAEWHQRVLTLRTHLLGPENPATLTTKNHLAVAYTDLGRLGEAEELHSQLLKFRRRLYGLENKDTLWTVYYLASTQVGLQKWLEVEELLLETLPIFDRVLGKSHAHSMTGLSLLALTYEHTGRWTDAERYEKELLVRRRQTQGEHHPDTLATMQSLSIVYQYQRRWQEVDSIEESIQRLNLPPSNSRTQTTWYSAATRLLASTNQSNTTSQSGGSFQSIDTAVITGILGPDHPESIACSERDAISFIEQQRWAEAEAVLTDVLARRRRIQGNGHPFTIQTMSNLASAFQSQSKNDSAIDVFQTALTELEGNLHATDEHIRADVQDRLSNLHNHTQFSLKPPHIPGVLEHGKKRVIAATITSEEVMAYLTSVRCPDLTRSIDESKCGDPIQRGGFGEVSKGTLHDGRMVALKYMREDRSKRLKYLARELYSWSKTRHQNVLELFGLAHFRGNIVMVSPWMEFGNLRDYLERHPGIDRLSVVIQVVEGVVYLHNVPMIHGDLKAANIFVSEDGIAKIGDFGTSTFQGDQSIGFSSTVNEIVGTFRWMAPEMFREKGGCSRETDVYALGMTILEVITGKVPFREYDHDFQVIGAVVQGATPICPREISPGSKLWILLNKCWDQVARERPTADRILHEMLEFASDGGADSWTFV
ncbi:kinesin light chain [Rhizoctonia solani AG-3 Rhs1AP]|uniref:Kinesin light chain n=1 Tax=Rhizoctonia solani AG-3 Rhs1AP TaxID=1086054 RepID=X8IUQ6_9AGAM|nr:kinesin light chain [Rhizoctonia solani AG-3 Rhs1AP]